MWFFRYHGQEGIHWWYHWFLLMVESQLQYWTRRKFEMEAVTGRNQCTKQWSSLRIWRRGRLMRDHIMLSSQLYVVFWNFEVFDIDLFLFSTRCERLKFDRNVLETLQGLSKFGLLGEVSIDFADYALATKICKLSLPLKNTKFEAVLNVSSYCSSALYLQCSD